MKKNIAYLFLGVFFGFALSRVGASDYELIFGMFAGEDLKLALVMGTAIIVGGLGMALLRNMGYKGYKGQPIEVNKKDLNKYTAIGGALFGIGWAISGACPGTVIAQLGEGKIFGAMTFLGMIAGTYLYAYIAEKHPSVYF